jgi:hypothetical protein
MYSIKKNIPLQLIFIIKKTNMKSLKELELSVPSLDLSSSKNLMGGDGYSGHWEYEDGTPITSNTVEDHDHGDPIYVVDLPDVVVIGEKPGSEIDPPDPDPIHGPEGPDPIPDPIDPDPTNNPAPNPDPDPYSGGTGSDSHPGSSDGHDGGSSDGHSGSSGGDNDNSESSHGHSDGTTDGQDDNGDDDHPGGHGSSSSSSSDALQSYFRSINYDDFIKDFAKAYGDASNIASVWSALESDNFFKSLGKISGYVDSIFGSLGATFTNYFAYQGITDGHVSPNDIGQAVAAGLADGAIVCAIIPVFGPEVGGALELGSIVVGYTSDLFLPDDEGHTQLDTIQELLNQASEAIDINDFVNGLSESVYVPDDASFSPVVVQPH